MEQAAEKNKKTFTDLLRVRFKGLLDPIGVALNGIGLTPNAITLLGLAGNTVGAILIATGQVTWGGVVVLLMGPLDALDGTMARLRGKTTRFGAVLDSVTDRYSELVILAGLLVFFLLHGSLLGAGLTYAAAAGSVQVSYVKARAQALGFSCEVGILTRAERYLVMAPLLVLNLPLIAVGIIAVLANITAVQRIVHVYMQSRSAVDQPGTGTGED
ncbi:MAG TPA: CDP-alcohol phosphatidyltransferase family protein [Anaerolineaceae bacterium]